MYTISEEASTLKVIGDEFPPTLNSKFSLSHVMSDVVGNHALVETSQYWNSPCVAPSKYLES